MIVGGCGNRCKLSGGGRAGGMGWGYLMRRPGWFEVLSCGFINVRAGVGGDDWRKQYSRSPGTPPPPDVVQRN